MPVTRKKAANVATPRAKVARLEARITVEQKQILERAADLQGRSLTEFVVNSAHEAARAAIREHELMSLTARDTKAFVNALLKPPSPGWLLFFMCLIVMLTWLLKRKLQHKSLLPTTYFTGGCISKHQKSFACIQGIEGY